MKLSEFIEQGYTINAQVHVIDTREILLSELQNGNDVEECLGDVIDSWVDDCEPVKKISYDIINPDGELISGYKPTLFTGKDVREFIAKL